MGFHVTIVVNYTIHTMGEERLDTEKKPFRINLVKGLISPRKYFPSLKDACEIKGLSLWLLILVLANTLIQSIFSYFKVKIKNDFPEEGITPLDPSEIQPRQMMAAINSLSTSWVTTILIIVITAGILFLFFKITYKKMFIIQMHIFLISCLEDIARFISLLITKNSTNFFSLGSLLENSNVNPFFFVMANSLTLFFIWQMGLSIIALREITDQSKERITASVIGLYLLFLFLVSSVFVVLSRLPIF